MRIILTTLRLLIVGLVSIGVIAGAGIITTSPAEAASKPVIYYTGAQGDPDYAKLKFPDGTTLKVYIDDMKSGKVYRRVVKKGKYKTDQQVIIDNGSWAEIRLWFRVKGKKGHPVAIRKTDRAASSTQIK